MAWTQEQAREAARKGGAASKAARERRRKGGEESPELTSEDEGKALAVLRANMRSKDERIRHTAAVKLLEYAKGKPRTPEDDKEPQRIIYETSFLPPRDVVEAQVGDDVGAGR